MRRIASALLALLALSACPAAAARHAHPPPRDWTRVVALAPDGGYVMGNPAARARIVEYSSMTCPHCAAFAADDLPKLEQGYIRSGVASIEVRTALRDRYDLVAALLARCEGPRGYFDAAGLIFAHQQEWMQRAYLWEQGGGDAAIVTLPAGDAFAALADGAGLTRLIATRGGRTPAATRACLADPAPPKLLAAMADEAWSRRRIAGTPAFLVNGAAVDAHDFATLEPAVRAAAGLPPAPASAPASPKE